MRFSELGPLNLTPTPYGNSVRGIPLEVYLPDSGKARTLVMAAIHGDESISTVLLSECLRWLALGTLRAAVIPAANPDGILAGTRCNANGVDLNRNYPTSNWLPDPVYYRNRPDAPRNIALSPGSSPGSEPETRTLISLIESLQPSLIVSLHGFLGCIDDANNSAIGQQLAQRTGMELVTDIGYATPGSFGTWGAEQAIPIITYELPALSLPALREVHIPVLLDLMTGAYDQDQI